ncbi:MAG: Na(+)/H(+) antiporter subunit D [Desulfobulbaceae bacterium]|uniref:Na(+)/H(+) antiporter subunit D n=1 Tax=Candidatus Desulfatifera sulfidica TaxID=2841691 RepID=A0A8J6NAG4_9BACT|nr:Na(+)/H(+) antiporter subunit D [Candidatus Desulfatifera sulfidica]
MTSSFFHPALIMIIGAILLPLVRGPFRKPFLFLIPALTLLNVVYLSFNPGTYGVVQFMDWQLTFGRVDSLSMVFAFIMALMAVIGTIYGMHVEDEWQHVAAWFYVAGSLGVIYSGDYLVLFLFWEMMAFASTFLIWFNQEEGSTAAGFRYILVHTFGGVVLLLGFVLRYQATGDLSFSQMDVDNPQLYTWLIMIGLMLNAAVPPLHSWLPDAYSKATIAGSVFMCAFTTKTAVYTLARSCAGFDVLIVLGVIMTIYGIIYALMENDVRRLLGWEIVSQVGYMVAGVGIGTALAINGTAAHAFAHILYKGLLFMAAGAVIHATGKSKFTELGGLYKKMPVTLIFLLIGSLSVSAFPFLSGFVSKSIIISAAFESHILWAAFLLTVVSAGTFLVAGLRLPWLLFFGESRCSEETMEKACDPPWNMQLAMTIAGFLCILIGSYTPFLYNMLPNPELVYHPYTSYHLSETLQILALTGLGFFWLRKYIQARDTISLDLDWFYRKGGQGFLWLSKNPLQWFDTAWGKAYRVVGLSSLMTTSKFWSWFDWHAIDGIVDGIARCVLAMGRRISLVLQRGQIQQTIYYTLSFAAVLLISYVWF